MARQIAAADEAAGEPQSKKRAVVDTLELGDEFLIPQGDQDEDQAWGEALRNTGESAAGLVA